MPDTRKATIGDFKDGETLHTQQESFRIIKKLLNGAWEAESLQSGKTKVILEDHVNLYHIEEEYDPEKDLFEKYETLPQNVQDILKKYGDSCDTYETCQKMQDELEAVGYTFDWYLTAEPYNLRVYNPPQV